MYAGVPTSSGRVTASSRQSIARPRSAMLGRKAASSKTVPGLRSAWGGAAARHRAGFAHEALLKVAAVERRANELDRHSAIERIVLREQHDAHGAAAERSDHAVHASDERARLDPQHAVGASFRLAGRDGLKERER